MNTTLKFYFKQITDNMTSEDIRLVRLYNTHLMYSMENLRQYFLRNNILIVDDIECNICSSTDNTKEVKEIKTYIFILNDKYNYNNMCIHLNGIPEYKIEEEYEFKAKFEIILDNNIVTKYVVYGTDTNKYSGAKYKYYSYHSIEDTGTNKDFYNLKDI